MLRDSWCCALLTYKRSVLVNTRLGSTAICKTRKFSSLRISQVVLQRNETIQLVMAMPLKGTDKAIFELGTEAERKYPHIGSPGASGSPGSSGSPRCSGGARESGELREPREHTEPKASMELIEIVRVSDG